MTLKNAWRAVLLLVTVTGIACGRESGESALEAAPESVRTARQHVNSDNKVLILGSSVDGAMDSREAQAVLAVDPTTQIDVVTPEQWSALSATDFMSYRTLIIGDAACQSGTAAFQAAIDNRNVWGAIVDGDVAFLSTDPSHNRTPQLVESAIEFVLNSMQFRTGMYIALGCAYKDASANTPVTLLEPFGSFTVQGVPGCADSAHMLEMRNDLLSRYMTDDMLKGNGCAARSVFTSYPDHTFAFAALALSSSGAPIPAQSSYTDVTMDPENQTSFVSTPYIIVRGAMAEGSGCGFADATVATEECDLGDGLNGNPAADGQLASHTCSWSCHLHWCGDGHVDTALGEECDLGVNNGRTGDASGSIGACSSFCKIPNLTQATTQPPTALCRDVTQIAQYTCGVDANIDNGSYDSDNDLVGCTQSPAGPYPIGETTVTLTCTDRANHTSSCSSVVTVVDHVAPTVALAGPANQALECVAGGTYSDPGASASDLCDGALPGSITKTGSVNVGAPGSYALSYVARDGAGNASAPVTRTVTVADTLAPTLALNGALNTTLECGTPYTDPGASAVDQCAGNVTSVIQKTGAVNSQVPSTYTLRYNVSDGTGHTAQASRTVTVVDTQKPVVTVTGPLSVQVECGSGSYVDPGATATDACAGALSAVPTTTPNRNVLGTYSVRYTATDPAGNVGTSSSSRTVTVSDTLPPTLTLNGAASANLQCGATYTDPGATASDACAGNLTPSIVTTSNLDTAHSGQYSVTYSVSDPSGHVTTAVRQLTVGPCSTCTSVHLGDYTLFLLENFTNGHDIEGKAAAGGNITLADFSMGSHLPDNNISNTLVAGGNMSLVRGGVWGDAWYGGTFSADTTVVYPRGTVRHGTPIDFAARFAELRSLSAQLASRTANATATRETWGGVMLHGTNSSLNVFNVNASWFTGAVMMSIDAPAGSLAVINIRGASASFSGFGISLSGGITQRGVLYNFVDTTSINAHGFGFPGTLLAPNARVTFTDGSWNGGLYAVSLDGNAEGHIDPLTDRDICP